MMLMALPVCGYESFGMKAVTALIPKRRCGPALRGNLVPVLVLLILVMSKPVRFLTAARSHFLIKCTAATQPTLYVIQRAMALRALSFHVISTFAFLCERGRRRLEPGPL